MITVREYLFTVPPNVRQYTSMLAIAACLCTPYRCLIGTADGSILKVSARTGEISLKTQKKARLKIYEALPLQFSGLFAYDFINYTEPPHPANINHFTTNRINLH